MSKSIPKRKDWQDLKKDTDCPDEPVKGIKMGDSLDKFHAREAAISKLGFKERVSGGIDLYGEIEDFFVAFLKKVDPKTVKKFPQFQKTFLNDFIAVAKDQKEDMKRYTPTVESFQSDLTKFFAMLMKLEIGKATGAELMDFRRGPLRGLLATLARVPDDVPNAEKMTKLLKPYDDIINAKITAETPADKATLVIKSMIEASVKVKDLAKAEGVM